MNCGYYERVTFECIDGYLHDRDYDYVDPENIDYPCPQCNMKEFFIEEKRMLSGIVQDTGVNQWDNLIEWYVHNFSINREDLYKIFKETEELNVIEVIQDGARITFNYGSK